MPFPSYLSVLGTSDNPAVAKQPRNQFPWELASLTGEPGAVAAMKQPRSCAGWWLSESLGVTLGSGFWRVWGLQQQQSSLGAHALLGSGCSSCQRAQVPQQQQSSLETVLVLAALAPTARWPNGCTRLSKERELGFPPPTHTHGSQAPPPPHLFL